MTVFFCIRVNSSWIFHSQLPLTHFYSYFFCHLLPSAQLLKKSQNFIVTNFCIINTLFHHKYIDKSFTKGNKKMRFPAKAVSLPNQSPCQTSPPAKPAYWMQKLFKPLIQKSFVSHQHILEISYTHILATILFCSKDKKNKIT